MSNLQRQGFLRSYRLIVAIVGGFPGLRQAFSSLVPSQSRFLVRVVKIVTIVTTGRRQELPTRTTSLVMYRVGQITDFDSWGAVRPFCDDYPQDNGFPALND